MILKAAIFDVDGTLLGSMAIWQTIGEDYLKNLGLMPRQPLYPVLKDMSLEEAARYYQIEYGVDLDIQEILEGINGSLKDFYRDQVTLKPGVKSLLSLFQKKGIKMCIVTASDRKLVEETLRRLEIDSYFGEIFTCTEIGSGKDQPFIFEKALHFLQTPKRETMVFDDALYAIRSAKKAGFPVAAIADAFESQTQLVRQEADLYLEDFFHFDFDLIKKI